MLIDAAIRRDPPAETFDPPIAGLTVDSRQAAPGFLFAAFSGTRDDGRRYVTDALARGAVAVLSAPGLDRPSAPRPVTWLEAEEPRAAFARIAARFNAPLPRTRVAVTGTNGKTSVAWFVRQIWEALGHRAASVGTLGVVGTGIRREGALTTPDTAVFYGVLGELQRQGIEHVAFEASSHGLDQRRIDGASVAAAAFTNITRDHLDYHGTMAAYLAAKERLFTTLLAEDGAAVLNADVPEFAALAHGATGCGQRVIDYGRAARMLRLVAAAPKPEGLALSLAIEGTPVAVELPLVGAFQAMNALAALGLVIGAGADAAAAVEALRRIGAVPGRMQRAAARQNGAAIFVDYAHTPDALETVLMAIRPHVRGRLAVVFGCGGDRDPGKRPMMGAVAARLADRAIVTDDNPRSEDPATIRRAIMAACPGGIEIGGRADAIAAAVAELAPGDVLMIAGKGHEQGQIIAGHTFPFDDVTVASAAVAAADGAPA